MLRNLGKEIEIGTANVTVDGLVATFSDKLGQISVQIPDSAQCVVVQNAIKVTANQVAGQMAMIGTFIALVKQSIVGVTSGHSRIVNFTGTGASVKISNGFLEMKLGKSHTIFKQIPEGIKCNIESSDIRQTRLKVFGISNQQVGQFASELRIKRVYKGGIHAWVDGDKVFIKKRKGAK